MARRSIVRVRLHRRKPPLEAGLDVGSCSVDDGIQPLGVALPGQHRCRCTRRYTHSYKMSACMSVLTTDSIAVHARVYAHVDTSRPYACLRTHLTASTSALRCPTKRCSAPSRRADDSACSTAAARSVRLFVSPPSRRSPTGPACSDGPARGVGGTWGRPARGSWMVARSIIGGLAVLGRRGGQSCLAEVRTAESGLHSPAGADGALPASGAAATTGATTSLLVRPFACCMFDRRIVAIS